MVGLDLTHQALATPEVAAKVRAVGTTPAQFVLELFEFFTAGYKDSQGFEYPPVHRCHSAGRSSGGVSRLCLGAAVSFLAGRTHLIGAQRRHDDCPTLGVGELHFVGRLGECVDVNDRAYCACDEAFGRKVGDQPHEVEEFGHDSYLT
jgi:hypothetical protein